MTIDKITFERMAHKNGSVLYRGVKYALLTQAYLDWNVNNGHEWYQAYGVSMAGDQVLIKWEILKSYNPEMQEEDRACDWDNPESIEKN